MSARRIRVIDSHTGGEPTRVVVSGGLVLQLPLAFQAATFVAVLGNFLMVTAPARPSRDLVGCPGRHPEESDEQPTDFRDRDRDVGRTRRPPF